MFTIACLTSALEVCGNIGGGVGAHVCSVWCMQFKWEF